MPEISLRAYIDYIEDRLDRDAYSEVVAQCRHVLTAYPRYIPAYRLLGRALLEQENNQDALDLFQRVLSADPNDFVAHVGMSECYQEQGALDQALWHLERAFEQVPSNLDLQDEIKRLYTERDGQAPRKVPLTGGALARLYAKGGLYQQAIVELEKALDHDPERLDLQTLLADVLWQNHQEVEAGKAAARVLKRLPNSIVANRLLAQLWMRAGKPDEAAPFLERLRGLDPYAAYRIEHDGRAASAEAFVLKTLDLETGQTGPLEGAAAWVSQIPSVDKEEGVTGPLRERSVRRGGEEESGVPPSLDMDALFGDEGERREDELPLSAPLEPDWLDEVLSQPARPGPSTEELPDEQPVGTGQWLDAILGHDAEGESGEAVPPPEVGDEGAPDWLAGAAAIDLAPSAGVEEPVDLPPDEPEREAPAWLGEILGESSQPPEAAPESVPPGEAAPGGTEVVTDSWLDEIITGGPPPEEEAEADEVPDWVRELDQETKAEVAAPEDAQPSGVEEEPAGPPTGAAGPDEDLPDWLQPPEAAAGAGEPPAGAGEDLPDWLRDAVQPASPEASVPEPEETSDEARPDLLAAFEAAAEGEEPALREDMQVAPPTDEPTGEEGAQDVPDWLTEGDLDSDEAVEWLEQLASKYDPDFQPSEVSAPGEEMVSEPEPAAEAPPEAAPVAEAGPEEELPDWLRGEPAHEAAADAAVPPAGERERELPDWLRAEGEAEPIAEAPVEEEPEEVPAWLQEPPAREPEPVAEVRPDREADEGLPDWLLADREAEEAEPAAPEAAVPEPVAETPPEAAPVAEAESEEELPDWLRAEPAEAGEDLEWLREPAEPEAVSAPAAEDEALPGWLLAEDEAVPEAEGEEVKEEEAFAWLDEQVREQGVSPEEEVVSEALEADRPPTPAMAAEGTDAEPVAAGDLPDWLRDADAQDRMARAREDEDQAGDEEIERELAELAEVDTGDLSWLDSALEVEEAAVSEDELASLFADEDIDTEQLAALLEEGDEDLPDWLKETRGLDWEEAEREFEEMQEREEAVPDWLSELDQEEEPLEPAGEALEAAPAPEYEIGEVADEGELPDWLTGLGEAVAGAEAEEEPAVAAEPEEAEPVAEAEPAAEGLPDWLPPAPAEAEEEAELVAEAEEEVEPMAEAEEEAAPVAGAVPDTGPLVSEEIPDWLVSAVATPDAEAEEEPITEELPDWLTPAALDDEIEAVEEEPPLPVAEAEPIAEAEEEAEELPDWLAPAEAEEEVEPVAEAEEEAAPVAEADLETGQLVPEEKVLLPAEPEPVAIAEPEEVEPVMVEPEEAEPEPEVLEAEPEPVVVVEGDFDEQLRRAREKLEPETIREALPYYENLVGEDQMLEQTVSDLRYVIQQAQETDPRVSRTLGDALRKQGSLQEALEAYRSALDALE
jgi:tetratricopeptide (TPR) repeat protein